MRRGTRERRSRVGEDPTQRTIVVGDVQGCLAELEALLGACGYRTADRLVFVGDLVAKGPDSQGVVQLAREAGALAVLGNHEDRVLRLRRNDGRSRPPVKPEHQRVLDTLTSRDWEYLERLPLVLRLGRTGEDTEETAVVHAGAVPGVPLDRQRREHLLKLRSIDARGVPTDRVEPRPWASLWRGPERIIFGHDAVRGMQSYPFATGIDTGCVYGGRLTTILLPERRLVSVPAARAYAPMRRP